MEIAQAYAWVSATASADSALVAAASGGIWQGLADDSVTAPFLSYGRQADTDVLTVNGVRIYASILMRILAIGPSAQFAALVTIANRIDALFDVKNVGLPGGGGVMASYREQQLSQEQMVNGKQWSQLGGLYRIMLKGT